ncbi:MAG TPA: biotin/lipoyl-containing protein [Candidatus Bathyarchaeia archaeon]|nr:biotin/lipoyl-containing protein [Candidatus Bathyarchaeia archaeon]
MPILSIEGKKYRLGDLAGQEMHWAVPVDDHTIKLEILRQTSSIPPSLLIRVGPRVIRVSGRKDIGENMIMVELDGRPLLARLEEESVASHTSDSAIAGPVVVSSPMAGKIAAVKTSKGSTVDEGQALIVLEAMKMENEIAAPKKGTVKEIYVEQGALARPGDKLVLIE